MRDAGSILSLRVGSLLLLPSSRQAPRGSVGALSGSILSIAVSSRVRQISAGTRAGVHACMHVCIRSGVEGAILGARCIKPDRTGQRSVRKRTRALLAGFVWTKQNRLLSASYTRDDVSNVTGIAALR